jgi:chemotaxis protein CheX
MTFCPQAQIEAWLFLPTYNSMAGKSETAGSTTAVRAGSDGKSVAPRSEWLGILRDATAEVFSMMVGSTVVTPETADCPVSAYITGVIGITGAVSAILTVRCSDASATKVASQMLGVSTEEAAAQKSDAIGEICNIVAGHFKLKIGCGDTCMLTVPSVITGGNYRIHSLAAGQRLEFPLLYEGEPMWLALDIRK